MEDARRGTAEIVEDPAEKALRNVERVVGLLGVIEGADRVGRAQHGARVERDDGLVVDGDLASVVVSRILAKKASDAGVMSEEEYKREMRELAAESVGMASDADLEAWLAARTAARERKATGGQA